MQRPVTLFSAVFFAAVVSALGCNRSESGQAKPEAAASAAAPQAPGKPDSNGRLNIEVTSDGFSPALSHVKVGEPVTLVVTRKVEKTCATEIVMEGQGVNQPLPLNQPVEVKITPTKAGKIPFSCAMHMITGELVAE